MQTVAERVQRGIEWLDANGPEDWRALVVINDLKLDLPCRCVLGQVFADDAEVHGRNGFVYATRMFQFMDAVSHGFDADYAEECGPTADFENLTDEWKRRLSQLPLGEQLSPA